MQTAQKTKLLLFWDYDGEAGGEKSLSGTKNAGINGYNGTQKILELLEMHNLKAVFACVGVLGEQGSLPFHAQEQIREIAERGHEVGSHSWTHEYIPELKKERLLEILKKSKEVLERASGTEVISFVPPWNMPYRYLAKGSLGLSQFRRGFRQYTDIPAMCAALNVAGFKAGRIYYEPVGEMFAKRLLGRRGFFQPVCPELINGITCVRVNLPGGFGSDTIKTLDSFRGKGGIATLWAHPHSLLSDNTQSEKYFLQFLEYFKSVHNEFEVVLMKDLIANGTAA